MKFWDIKYLIKIQWKPSKNVYMAHWYCLSLHISKKQTAQLSLLPHHGAHGNVLREIPCSSFNYDDLQQNRTTHPLGVARQPAGTTINQCMTNAAACILFAIPGQCAGSHSDWQTLSFLSCHIYDRAFISYSLKKLLPGLQDSNVWYKSTIDDGFRQEASAPQKKNPKSLQILKLSQVGSQCGDVQHGV